MRTRGKNGCVTITETGKAIPGFSLSFSTSRFLLKALVATGCARHFHFVLAF